MLRSSADAKTSAGAPSVSWVTRSLEPAKANSTHLAFGDFPESGHHFLVSAGDKGIIPFVILFDPFDGHLHDQESVVDLLQAIFNGYSGH